MFVEKIRAKKRSQNIGKENYCLYCDEDCNNCLIFLRKDL